MYQKVPITIEPHQFKKLVKGHPVQLAPHQLHPHHKHHVMVHPLMAAKMHKARVAGRGVRIQMTPHEIEMTGAGWGDLWNSVKSAAKSAYNWGRENIPKAISYVKENVIDTPFYQENIRPKLREKIEDFAESRPYSNYSIPAIEYLGDQTGAWGMKKKHRKAPTGGRIVQQRRKKVATRRMVGSSFMV